ncbi:MAG: glycosyltransferase [Aeriscardovia sp.]|nr:glycosyltransferase [Aeriscardovia sp.]
MDLIIVNTQPIPSSGVGAASVNRILSYTKGLIKDGNVVKILSTANGDNKNWGHFEGVPVLHLGNRSKGLPRRVVGYIVTTCRLLRALKKEKKDVVIFVTSNYFLTIILEIYCKVSNTRVVNERSEYPFILMTQNRLKRLFAPLYTNTAYKLLDGMIIMTQPLMTYYKKKAGKHCRFIEVPMTVDSQRFSSKAVGNVEQRFGNYIAYCGNMGGNKDGLPNLLKAFSIVEKRGIPLNLVLIGGAANQQEYDTLKSLNASLGNKHVVFFGKANRDEMPGLLHGATMLALARPSGLQSTGGFPTKLGEYLSTGNPVVVTAVGDIPQYLHDRENAYVVAPDDNEAFADAICYVWENKQQATLVGKKGQELASTVFNGDYQAKRIESFLHELIEKA